jgi:YfiR/HmsC-like
VRLPKRHYPSSSTSPAALPARGIGRRCWIFLAAGVGVSVLLALHLGQTPLGAQEEEEMSANREYRIKAAYLYQFGRYVDWPAKAFSSAKSPFVIGVLEQDPLIPDLEQIARVKKIQDRSIKIQRFSSPADIRPCHILYLPASLAPEAQAEVVRKVVGHSVLLVGDSPNVLEWGGTMQFVVEDNKIRVVISRKAAEVAGLTVSAKLLQVARVVD